MRFWRAALVASQMVFFVTAAHAQDTKPPFADGPTEKKQPKPETRTWNVTKDGYSMSYLFLPGIPDPGKVTEIEIIASSIPATPHPRYGSRVPLDGARLILAITNPAGEVVGRYLAHEIPLSSGKYGLHFTASQEGIYSVSLEGRTADGKTFESTVKMPVAVWPLPKELQGTGDASGTRTARRVIRKPMGGK